MAAYALTHRVVEDCTVCATMRGLPSYLFVCLWCMFLMTTTAFMCVSFAESVCWIISKSVE